MTNEELLAKIKAEIERRMKIYKESNYGISFRYQELEELLSFLSTLESETTYDTQQYTPRPSLDIEDVARVQFASHAKVFDKKRKAVFDWEQFKEVASIFYGFGKKDSSDTLESEKPMQEGLEEEISLWISENENIHHNDRLMVGLFKDVSNHFYEIGCRRTAEKYDEIEYNRQRAEESVPNDLEEAAKDYAYNEGYQDPEYYNIVETFIAAAKWDREQMMAEAVEGEIQMKYNGGLCAKTIRPISEDMFRLGDKVRIIIVKE